MKASNKAPDLQTVAVSMFAFVALFMAILSAPATHAASTARAASECTGNYPPVDVAMTLQQVSEHVWYVQGAAGSATDNAGFISDAAVIIGKQAIAVFDSLGSPSLAQKLLHRIRKLSDLPIRHVIASHYHADHIYGLQVFKEQGAIITGPEAANDYIGSAVAEERLEERRFSLEPWVNDCTRLIPPDRYVKQQPVTIDLGGVSIKVHLLGAAHSKGDLAAVVEPDQVLLSGDIIFEGRVPFVGDANTATWLKVLTELETRGIKALIPGHGAAAKDPQQAIQLTRKYLAFLRKTMATAVDELTPFDEAYAAADWSEFASLPAFEAANRKNAYQVFLSMEAESLGAE